MEEIDQRIEQQTTKMIAILDEITLLWPELNAVKNEIKMLRLQKAKHEKDNAGIQNIS
jgi:hypothetical protein